MRNLPALAVLAASILTLTGCPEPACDTMAALSILVTVVDEGGLDIDDATVTYAPEGEAAQDCEGNPDGYACGWEVSGDIEIVVVADGYLTHTETVTVEEDTCHVIQETLDVVLEEDDVGVFGEDRVYVHDVYDTQQECDEAMDLGLNCYQIVEFCDDGEAAIMLTDIINPGTYTLAPNEVTASFPGGDAPDTMIFSLTGDDLATDSTYWLEWYRSDDPIFSMGACAP
jgi:hypothetical protein